eukprot:CAMPEP_0180247840 /NCGR_PEP_ID=MMETSP0987-20121128/36375_1 /TAXON_ID=697907 /ORGANISM="non described non described, Strain CCMP2293" /LENGTH=108 /DNA_ID=CAMNT_0022215855 /DNA_START=54 /DNA_END=376 /DNA_ORIENTATION=+
MSSLLNILCERRWGETRVPGCCVVFEKADGCPATLVAISWKIGCSRDLIDVCWGPCPCADASPGEGCTVEYVSVRVEPGARVFENDPKVRMDTVDIAALPEPSPCCPL